MLNAGPALRIALYNASPKGLQNLSLVAAASVVVIVIRFAQSEPCKCINCLKIEQACSNLKWVCAIGLLKIEQACTNLKRMCVIGLLKIEQACTNLKQECVIGLLKNRTSL